MMTSTFSQPLPIGQGKSFALGMVTVGHWTNAKMDHDWLYWDNADFMQQIGLGQ